MKNFEQELIDFLNVIKEEYTDKYGQLEIISCTNGNSGEIGPTVERVVKDYLKSKNTIIYAFLYNSCTHDSSWATMSLHFTEEGAVKAMNEHKQNALHEFNEMYAINNEFGFKFGASEDWFVKPIEILP